MTRDSEFRRLSSAAQQRVIGILAEGWMRALAILWPKAFKVWSRQCERLMAAPVGDREGVDEGDAFVLGLIKTAGRMRRK